MWALLWILPNTLGNRLLWSFKNLSRERLKTSLNLNLRDRLCTHLLKIKMSLMVISFWTYAKTTINLLMGKPKQAVLRTITTPSMMILWASLVVLSLGVLIATDHFSRNMIMADIAQAILLRTQDWVSLGYPIVLWLRVWAKSLRATENSERRWKRCWQWIWTEGV